MKRTDNDSSSPLKNSQEVEEITRERGLQAFRALRKQAQENGVQDLTMEEIDEEIRKARYGED